jgi:hypothetical protein
MLSGAESPIGRRLRVPGPTSDADEVYEIVGVVSDTKYGGRLIYLPASQDPEPAPYVSS